MSKRMSSGLLYIQLGSLLEVPHAKETWLAGAACYSLPHKRANNNTLSERHSLLTRTQDHFNLTQQPMPLFGMQMGYDLDR